MVRTGETIGLVGAAVVARDQGADDGGQAPPHPQQPSPAASASRSSGAAALPIARTLRVGLEYDDVARPGRAPPSRPPLRDVPGVAAHPAPVAYLTASTTRRSSTSCATGSRTTPATSRSTRGFASASGTASTREKIAFAYPVIRQHQYAYGSRCRSPTRTAGRSASIDGAASSSRPLSDEERQRLAAGRAPDRFGEGEIDRARGRRRRRPCSSSRGRAAVSVHGGDVADSRKVAVLEPGAAFGEISLLTGEPRTRDRPGADRGDARRDRQGHARADSRGQPVARRQARPHHRSSAGATPPIAALRPRRGARRSRTRSRSASGSPGSSA